MRRAQSEYASPNHVSVHVSDGHPRAGLGEVRESIEASGLGPEAIIFSGDLANRRSIAAYRRLRATYEGHAKRMGAAVIGAMGNHDDCFGFDVLRDEEHVVGLRERQGIPAAAGCRSCQLQALPPVSAATEGTGAARLVWKEQPWN